MKTINRGWLLRQAREGRLTGRCTLRLTDDYRGDNADNFGKTGWLPVRVREDYDDFVSGILNLWESDFQSKAGHARRENGNIHLRVHSNLHYELRLKEGNNP